MVSSSQQQNPNEDSHIYLHHHFPSSEHPQLTARQQQHLPNWASITNTPASFNSNYIPLLPAESVSKVPAGHFIRQTSLGSPNSCRIKSTLSLTLKRFTVRLPSDMRFSFRLFPVTPNTNMAGPPLAVSIPWSTVLSPFLPLHL